MYRQNSPSNPKFKFKTIIDKEEQDDLLASAPQGKFRVNRGRDQRMMSNRFHQFQIIGPPGPAPIRKSTNMNSKAMNHSLLQQSVTHQDASGD